MKYEILGLLCHSCLFFIISDGLFASYIVLDSVVVHGRVETQSQVIHTAGRRQDLFTYTFNPNTKKDSSCHYKNI